MSVAVLISFPAVDLACNSDYFRFALWSFDRESFSITHIFFYGYITLHALYTCMYFMYNSDFPSCVYIMLCSVLFMHTLSCTTPKVDSNDCNSLAMILCGSEFSQTAVKCHFTIPADAVLGVNGQRN